MYFFRKVHHSLLALRNTSWYFSVLPGDHFKQQSQQQNTKMQKMWH